MIRMAQKYNNREDEITFTRMIKSFNPDEENKNYNKSKLPPQITSFFTGKPLVLDDKIENGILEDYTTQTFYAPNVSWFVQRNGMDRQNGLMISQVASLGNHAHANGISMELYGKGYVLGAESGRGSSYFLPDYLEYYSQFPAHNTVMVDGISSYPEMLSHHAFDLLSCYPSPGQKDGYYPDITFSDVYFLEPESRSDQNRFLSIVRTSGTSGYYLDIFRSKKQRKGDKFHDYFYHNLGQELFIQDAKGNPLNLEPGDEIAFAGGHLFALDYIWDKKSVNTREDYQAVWKMSMPDGNHVYMNLWMRGYPGREVFSIKAPPTKAFRANHGLPYKVDEEPYLTIVARQHGEAWNRPFVSVFEPFTEKRGRSIQSVEAFEADNQRLLSPDFAGIKVIGKYGRTDYIFSSTEDQIATFNQMSVNATYALISENGKDFILFMGNGTSLSSGKVSIQAEKKTTAALECKEGEYWLVCEAPVTVTVNNGKKVKFEKTSYQKIKL
jgi:hypothetical protein